MYGRAGYCGSTASPNNPPSADAFTSSTSPTSLTCPPAIRLIFPESRSATNALLSGKNASPHGTSIPVATVEATVSFTPPGCTVVLDPLGADALPELLGVASE